MKEKIISKLLLLTAFSALSVLSLIALFILVESLAIFKEFSIIKFIFGMKWSPSTKTFGIFPMIVSSVWVTLGALIIGVPLGLGCSIVLVEFAGKKISLIIRPTIQLLAGIPSVVYGFIGVIVLVPFIRDYLGGPGFSIMSASIILGIMILPTIISISSDAIESVPRAYKEGSIALGATQWQTIIKVILPSAKSGIIASIILGIGRAIGETMAVIMVIGNAPRIPESFLHPARTLTSNIALEMGYSTGVHRSALFATGVVLFIFIMILNVIVNLTSRPRR